MKPNTKTLILTTLFLLLLNTVKTGSQVDGNSMTGGQGSNKDEIPCNKDLLNTFGIDLSTQTNSFRATFAEKKYCTRNSLTCCSSYHIERAKAKYIQAQTQLRKRFTIIEELLSLFIGPAYQQVFYELKENNKCDFVLTQEGLQKDIFFDEENLTRQTDQIKTLLLDLKAYLNRNLWFYRDFICTICNPNNDEFFTLNESGSGSMGEPSSMTAHVSMCSDLYEIKDFEVKLVKSIAGFIHPYVKLINCSSDNGEAVIPLDLDTMSDIQDKLDDCFKHNFDHTNEDCHEICHKSILQYNFPIPIFDSAKSALKIIYEKLTKKNINEFYETTHQEAFDLTNNDQAIFFYEPSNADIQKYNIAEMTWTIETDSGVSIFHNEMSKLFTVKSTFILSIFASLWILIA